MEAKELEIHEAEDGSYIKVKLHPQAGRNSIDGIQEGKLKVNVTSPPEKGKANEALLKLLSRILGIAKSNIEIVSGETSREKVILVKGFDAEKIKSLLKC